MRVVAHNLFLSSLVIALGAYVLMDRWQPLYHATLPVAAQAQPDTASNDFRQAIVSVMIKDSRFLENRGREESPIFRRILPRDPAEALLASTWHEGLEAGNSTATVVASARHPYVAMRSAEIFGHALSGEPAMGDPAISPEAGAIAAQKQVVTQLLIVVVAVFMIGVAVSIGLRGGPARLWSRQTNRLAVGVVTVLLLGASAEAVRTQAIGTALSQADQWRWVNPVQVTAQLEQAQRYSSDVRASVAAAKASFAVQQYLEIDGTADATRPALRAAALVHYEQALAQSPLNPDLLSGYALMLSEGPLDGQFEPVYARAARSGPYESVVQYRLALAGFRQFLSLSPDSQAIAVDVAKRGLLHPSYAQQERMANLLESMGFLQIICRQLESTSTGCSSG